MQPVHVTDTCYYWSATPGMPSTGTPCGAPAVYCSLRVVSSAVTANWCLDHGAHILASEVAADYNLKVTALCQHHGLCDADAEYIHLITRKVYCKSHGSQEQVSHMAYLLAGDLEQKLLNASAVPPAEKEPEGLALLDERNACMCNFHGCTGKVEWRSKNGAAYLCDVHQKEYPASMLERFTSDQLVGVVLVDVNNGKEGGFNLAPALHKANELGIDNRVLIGVGWEEGVELAKAKIALRYQSVVPVMKVHELEELQKQVTELKTTLRKAESERDQLRSLVASNKVDLEALHAYAESQERAVAGLNQLIEKQKLMLADGRVETYTLPDLSDLV